MKTIVWLGSGAGNVLVALGLATASCGSGDHSDTAALKTQVAALQTQVATTAATSVDRVVAVNDSCNVSNYFSNGAFIQSGVATSGPDCAGPLQGNLARMPIAHPNLGGPTYYSVDVESVRAQLTVRTPQGLTYPVAVARPTRLIQVGDPWP